MNQPLRKKLLRMRIVDQEMRKKKEWDEDADRKNVELLRGIIGRYGWPKISDVGVDGSEAAWLVVQHADFDVVFQKKCLSLMKKLAKDNEVQLYHLAYLTDRILINSGKKQIFGTQTFRTKQGSLHLKPVQSRKNLDAKRIRFQLPPLKMYLEKLKQFSKK